MAKTLLDIDELNAVLATALDAVVVMDTDGVVRGWNAVAARTFGREADEVVGLRMSEAIIPERYREAHERGLAHFLSTGEGPVLGRHIEIEGLCADGSEIPVELSISYTEHFGPPVFLGFLRDIGERRRAEETRKILIAELNHRVKNLLGVVSAIAHQTLRTNPSPASFAEEFTGRLGSLARSHEILTAENWQHGSLRRLVALLTQAIPDGEDRIACDGPDIALVPKEFLAVSMILHELLTNAIKYGALAGGAGALEVEWSQEDEVLRLDWREHVPSRGGVPERRGFGLRMIDFSVRHDLNGSADWNWTGQGLHFHMRFAPKLATQGEASG